MGADIERNDLDVAKFLRLNKGKRGLAAACPAIDGKARPDGGTNMRRGSAAGRATPRKNYLLCRRVVYTHGSIYKITFYKLAIN